MAFLRKFSSELKISSSGDEHVNQKILIGSNDIINTITLKAEKIKNDICSENISLLNYLEEITSSVKLIKKEINTLKNKTESKAVNTSEKINTFLFIVNSINSIKSDLFKINELVTSLTQVSCDNEENSMKVKKKFNDVSEVLDLLVQMIYEISQNDVELNFDIVILN